MATGKKIDEALQSSLKADPNYYGVFTLVLSAVNTLLLLFLLLK